jgi:hypothetical protein
MMGGVAFILLKVGRRWPESAKQAEIRLATLLKILQIARFWGENPRARRLRAEKDMQGLYWRDFGRIWLIRPESYALLSRSHF